MNMMLDMKRIRQRSIKLTRLLMLGLPFFLPAYVLRFQIVHFPTTALEAYIAFVILFFTIAHGRKGWMKASAMIGTWRSPILFWSLVSFASVFWSLNIISGLGLWRAFVLEPILVFFILRIVLETKEDRERFLHHLYFTVIGISIWSLWQFVTGHGIPSPWDVPIADGRRATGLFPFPNAVALFVVPICAYAAARFSKRKEWLSGLTFLAGLLAVVLAKSDGGLIALVSASIFALLFSSWGRKLAFIIFVVGGIIFATQPDIRATMVREVTFQTWSGQVRLTIWKETWEMLKEHPVLGAGFAGYPAVFVEYHKATYIEIFQYPHTILFNVWSETGIFGVLAFGWILFAWARIAPRESKIATFAVIIAILIHGLVDVPYFKNDLAMLFWILIFLTTTTRIDVKEGHG